MKNTVYPNIVEFEVTGDYALFSDPVTRQGGEKCSYQVPTYEALKGIAMSIYWKPTFVWYIDAVRVMNPIQMEVKGMAPMKYNSQARDLAYYTYLKDCRYQVRAHFEWNENRPELAKDRNENKHHEIAKRALSRGGRRDIFLGTRECQAYVEPCVFGEGEGAYDKLPQLAFGVMLHGITYPDEAYSDETKGKLTTNFWLPMMENGIITFPRPEDCPMHKTVRAMDMKIFDRSAENFTGLAEFEGVI